MLEPNVIYVWRIALDSDWNGDEERAARWRALLSPEEVLRADAFRTETLRCHYVMAHGALRVVLGACLGMEPRSVALTVRQPSHGGDAGASPTKPALADFMRGEAMTDLRFNLSHTSGAALIAATLGREIGVDIERIRPMEDLEAIGLSIFSAVEGSHWESLRDDDRLVAFYRVWTRKEAYLKAIGLGLFRNLQDVTVPADAAALKGIGDARLVRDATGKSDWRVTDVPVGEGYCGAVSWEGDGVSSIQVADLSSDLDGNLSVAAGGRKRSSS